LDEISRDNQIFRINNETTYYAYGLGVLGEKKEDWSYYLNDGLSTTRQMSDASGYVILSRSFTPWGELLELHSEGDFSWGYLGSILEAATGLIYVGNGQYYYRRISTERR